MSETGVFSKLSDDVILNILYKLEGDPRNWARIACLSAKFSTLISTVCCKAKCLQSIPAVVSDLPPPGGWASLYKLSVCCPGLLHSGVLVDRKSRPDGENGLLRFSGSEKADAHHESSASGSDCAWSLFDSSYNDSESLTEKRADVQPDFSVSRSHLASGIWNLSREQGNKLLASRFKGDCLYICDWPGCVHVEEKRNYMLFRGIFKNFKQSRVWTTISDGNKSKIDLNCVFCSSKQTWNLHSSFCLRRYFGYHDDGEPVVRAYVCENGHVSGAWTYCSLYT